MLAVLLLCGSYCIDLQRVSWASMSMETSRLVQGTRIPLATAVLVSQCRERVSLTPPSWAAAGDKLANRSSVMIARLLPVRGLVFCDLVCGAVRST